MNYMNPLANALFTLTQQKVLGLLYSQPQQSFYTNEIRRRTGMGVATIKRELDRMVGSGILTLTKVGNQHHYQANSECPIFDELRSIVRKTLGVREILREALSPYEQNIVWSFVFGSIASGKGHTGSDIDLMIIGDVGFAEIAAALYPVQESVGREINPKIFHPTEWQEKREQQDAFVRDVMSKPRINIQGQGNDSGKSPRHQPGIDNA